MVIQLKGKWHKGAAYDLHTISSTFLGPNEFGHDTFENKRSLMGELVYKLKYKNDISFINQIIDLLDVFSGIENYDMYIPIPQTNKTRPNNPVELIAKALGQRKGVQVECGNLVNSGDVELKSISDPVEREERLRQAIQLNSPDRTAGKRIVLIDDLYRSGSTLTAATDLLYGAGNAAIVSVLTMTKTRSNR